MAREEREGEEQEQGISGEDSDREGEIDARASTQSSLKKVLIVGPDIKISEENKRLCEREGCLLIGDGKRYVTKQEIREQLSERVDSRTEFFINGHGDASTGEHRIAILQRLRSTREIFSILSSLAPGVPLRVNVSSCYAGASAKDVDVLPVGSSVVAFGPEDAVTWSSIRDTIVEKELQRELSESRFFDIADVLKYGASQTLTLGIKLTNRSVKKFSTRPPIHALLSIEEVERYFQYQCEVVYEQLRELDRDGLLPKSLALPTSTFRVRITEEELKQLRRDWFRFEFGSYSRTYEVGRFRPFFEADRVLGGNALSVSAQKGEISQIKYLISEGVDPSQPDRDGWTPLSIAAYYGQIMAIKELIALGADINKSDGRGWTALTIAAANGRVEVVRELVEQGASINQFNRSGWTALTIAAFNGKVEVVRELVRLGADPSQRKKFLFSMQLGQKASFFVDKDNPKLIATLKLAEDIHNGIAWGMGKRSYYRESENEKLIRISIASEILGEVFKQFDAEMLQSLSSEVVECVMQEVDKNKRLKGRIEDWKSLNTWDLKTDLSIKPVLYNVEEMVRRSKEEVTRAASTQEVSRLGGVLRGAGSVATALARWLRGGKGRSGGTSRE